MNASWNRCASSSNSGVSPNLLFRTFVESGRTWSVTSAHSAALILNRRRGGGGVSRLDILSLR